MPYDRPVVGYGGRNINTLRLWSAVAPQEFDFHRFSAGDFVAALTETLAAGSLTRVLYPDDSTCAVRDCGSYRNTSWWPARSPIWSGAFGLTNADWSQLPEKVAIQLNDTHPALAGAGAHAPSAR